VTHFEQEFFFEEEESISYLLDQFGDFGYCIADKFSETHCI
jgi:hypothetical protein